MGLLNVLSKFGKTATATNRSASNSRGKTVYADSSTVSSDEVPYYREDSYYTLYSLAIARPAAIPSQMVATLVFGGSSTESATLGTL